MALTHQQQTAQDFEAQQDDLQALALGAENMEQLAALLEGRGYITVTHTDAVTGEGGQRVFVFEDEAQDDGGVETPAPKRWQTIMERADGDLMKARGLVNWMLRKRARLLAEKSEKKEFAEAQIAQVEDWLAKEYRPRNNAIDGIDLSLEQWHREMGTKQESLPAGKLAWEKSRVETEWLTEAGLQAAVAHAFEQAADLTIDGCDSEDDAVRQAYCDAMFIRCLMEYVDLKKNPVKSLLTKDGEGGMKWADANGETHQVIAAHEKGEIPTVPMTEDEVFLAREDADDAGETGIEVPTRKPAEWVKQGETYEWKIKPT